MCLMVPCDGVMCSGVIRSRQSAYALPHTLTTHLALLCDGSLSKSPLAALLKCTLCLPVITMLRQIPGIVFSCLTDPSCPLPNVSPFPSISHQPSQSSGHHRLLLFSSTYKRDCEYLSFCGWLISLSILSSRFIHIVTRDRISKTE